MTNFKLTNPPSDATTFTVKITLLCDFQYDNFPMDTQLCPLRFFTETSQNVELHLHDPENKNHRSETNLDRLGFDITTNFVERSSSCDASKIMMQEAKRTLKKV